MSTNPLPNGPEVRVSPAVLTVVPELPPSPEVDDRLVTNGLHMQLISDDATDPVYGFLRDTVGYGTIRAEAVEGGGEVAVVAFLNAALREERLHYVVFGPNGYVPQVDLKDPASVRSLVSLACNNAIGGRRTNRASDDDPNLAREDDLLGDQLNRHPVEPFDDDFADRV